MNHNNIEMAILVKGRPITEYRHRGQIFVEGRNGSEYEIELRNNTPGRIEAVLSVDGLSVTDGKAAGDQSSGYMIEPRSAIRIPGWTLDNQQVAKFAFTGKQDGYATQMSGGDSRNNGVIGIMVFTEKLAPRYQLYNTSSVSGTNYNHRLYESNRGIACSTGNRYGSVTYDSSIIDQSFIGVMQNASSNRYDASTSYASTSCSLNDSRNNGSKSTKSVKKGLDHDREEKTSGGIVEQSLGTAFGDAANFKTTTVEFTRGDMLAKMVIYYDEARGLKARGIQMTRPSKQKYQEQPNAFPAMQTGCVPPVGWVR